MVVVTTINHYLKAPVQNVRIRLLILTVCNN